MLKKKVWWVNGKKELSHTNYHTVRIYIKIYSIEWEENRKWKKKNCESHDSENENEETTNGNNDEKWISRKNERCLREPVFPLALRHCWCKTGKKTTPNWMVRYIKLKFMCVFIRSYSRLLLIWFEYEH